jgi:hypothetical protein
MYAALWRALPGPVWVRAVLCAALAAIAVVVLFGWVFPVASTWLPFTDNTVGAATGGNG